MRLPFHVATTAQLGAAYPFAASRPLPARGVLVGRDLAGGPFCYDPFELYEKGLVTDPNMVVLGRIGRGKSALVKSFLLREAAFGRRAVVLDPKGEYGPVAEALGGRSLRLAPGGECRVNPLDLPVPAADGGREPALRRTRLELLGALGESVLGRRLSGGEALALEIALDTAVARAAHGAARTHPGPRGPSRREGGPPRESGGRAPQLDGVVDVLLGTATLGPAGRTRATGLRPGEGRDLGLELRRLVRGDLVGMFDGPTTPGLDLSGPAVVLDLSAASSGAALAPVMACAVAWVRGLLAAGGPPTILVVDEAWALLRDPGTARFLQSSFKLARSSATANVAVVHRPGDLAAVGGEGEVTTRLAEGLLSDCETAVAYAQAPRDLAAAAAVLGVREEELRSEASLPRGVAYWRVGRRLALVQHLLGAAERRLVDTDARLRAARVEGGSPGWSGDE